MNSHQSLSRSWENLGEMQRNRENQIKRQEKMLNSTKPCMHLRLNMHTVLKLNYMVVRKEMCSWAKSSLYQLN